MPNNVDEKVVQMTFDNKQFEKGVAQSVKSLEDLKKALELDKMNDSLRSLEQTTNSMSSNFSILQNSVNQVSKAFTPLGRIVYKAMDDMATAIERKAKSFAMLATGMESLQEGQQKYEKYTKSVQVITNATGKSIGEVSKVLDTLLKYTDETSYDFAEMVSSIGKFTSVGIDLERAEAAMEGIANWAAKSGAGKAEANRAMYNISQAMGAGYMKLIDWKSIENANMATKEFKEMAITTAEDMGVIAKNSGITYQNFNETLKDGWLTADVMTEVLARYSDTTTKFGLDAFHAAQEALTYTDAIDALKDAMSSGWMKSQEYLFGNLDEARVMWTNFANALIEFSDIFTSARNDLLKSWHELGGYTAAVEAVSNAWAAFMNIAYAVRDVIASLFPDNFDEQLVAMTEHVRDITAGWKEMFGIDTVTEVTEEVDAMINKAEQLTETLKRGAKSNSVAELQQQLIKNGYLKDKYGADGIYGPNTEAAVKKLQKALGVDVTGAWDKATRKAAAAKKVFMDTEKQEVTKQLRNVEEVTELEKKEIDHAEKLNKVLNRGGKKSDAVKALQEELIRLGYLTDKSGADGIYGKNTEAAVKKLQKAIGVDVTGAWDEQTIAAVKAKKTMVEVVEEEKTIYKETSGVTRQTLTIQDIVRAIGSTLKTLFSIVGAGIKIVVNVLSIFKPLVAVGIRLISVFLDMFTTMNEGIQAGNGIAKLSDAIITALTPLAYLILFVAKCIDDFINGYVKFLLLNEKENSFTSFFEYLAKALAGNTIVDGFISIFNSIKAVALTTVGFLISIFQSLFGPGIDEVTGEPKQSGFVTFFQTILATIETIISGIAISLQSVAILFISFFNSIKQYISPVKDSISGFFTSMIGDFKSGKIKTFQDFFNSLTTALNKFIPLTEKIKNAKDNFVNTFHEMFDLINNEAGDTDNAGPVANLFRNVRAFLLTLTKVDFAKYLIPALGGLATYGLFRSNFDPKAISDIFSLMFSKNSIKSGGANKALLKLIGGISAIGLVVGLLSTLDTEKVGKFFESFDDWFKETKIGKTFGKVTTDIRDKIVEWYGVAKKILQEKFPGVLKFFESKWNSLKNLFTFDSRMTFFENLQEKFETLKQVVKESIETIKAKLSKFKEYIVSLFTVDQATGHLKLFDELSNLVHLLDPLIDKFNGIKNKFVEIVTGIFSAADGEDQKKTGHSVFDIFSVIGKFLAKIGSINLGKVFDTAVTALLAYGWFRGSKALKNFSEGFNYFVSKGAIKKDNIGDTALKIAGAIVAISLAVGLLSIINTGKALIGLGILAAMVGGFIFAAKEFGKLKDKDNAMSDLGKNMLMMASSIAALAVGFGLLIAVFAIVSWTKAWGAMGLALALIAALIAGITFAEIQLKKGKGKNVNVNGVLDMCKGIVYLVLGLAGLIYVLKDTFKQEKGGWYVAGAFGLLTLLLGELFAFEYFLTHGIKGENQGKNVRMSGVLNMCMGVEVLVLAFGNLISILESHWTGAGGLQIGSAILILTGLLFGLYKIAEVMKSEKPEEDASKNLKALTIFVIGFGYSIRIIAGALANALKDTKGLDVWNMLVFLAGIAGLVGEFIGMLSVIKDLGSETKDIVKLGVALLGFGVFAAGIYFMAKGLGEASKNVADVNLGALAIFIGAIAIFIGEFIGMIAVIGKLDSETKDIVELGVALAGFAAFAWAVQYMAKGLAAAIQQINGVDPWVIGTFLVGIGVVLVAFAAAIRLVAPAIQLLGSIPIEALLIGILALLAIGVELGLLAALFTGIGIAAIEEFSVALKSIGTAVESFAGSFTSVAWDLVKASVDIATEAIGSLIGFFITNLASIESALEAAGWLRTIGIRLMLFNNSISVFSGDSAADTSATQTFVDGLGGIVNTLNGITLNSGVTDTITELGSALNLYYKMTHGIGIDKDTGEEFEIASDTGDAKIDPDKISEVFSKLSSSINPDDVAQVQSYAKGGSNDMTKAATGINAIAEALKSYGTIADNLDGDKIKVANGVIDLIAGIPAKLKEGESSFEQIFGVFGDGSDASNSKISQFGDDLALIGTAMQTYINSIADIDDGKIKIANGTIDFLANLNNKLPAQNSGFLGKFLFGSGALGNFASNIEDLGKGVHKYYDQIKNDDFGKVTESMTAVDSLADIASKLEVTGGAAAWFTGDKNIGNLGKGLGDLGSQLSTFVTNTNNFEYKQVEEQFKAIEKLIGLCNGLGAISYDKGIGRGGWSNKLEDIGIGISSMFTEIAGIYSNTIVTKEGYWDGWTKVPEETMPVLDAIAAIGSKLSQALADSMSESADGTSDGAGPIQKALFDTLVNAANAVKLLAEGSFIETGRYLGEGLIKGFKEKYGAILDFMEKLGIEVPEELRNVTEVHSPSEVFADIAKNWVLGLVKGVNENRDKLIDAFDPMLNKTVEALSQHPDIKDPYQYLIDYAKEAGHAFEDADREIQKYPLNFEDSLGLLPKDYKNPILDATEEIGDKVEETGDKIEEVVETTTDKLLKLDATLKRGSKGDEVKQLQTYLQQLGFMPKNSKIDGVYGKITEAAVKKFQKTIGIDESGIFDEATREQAKLYRKNKAKGLDKLSSGMIVSKSTRDNILKKAESMEEISEAIEQSDHATARVLHRMMFGTKDYDIKEDRLIDPKFVQRQKEIEEQDWELWMLYTDPGLESKDKMRIASSRMMKRRKLQLEQYGYLKPSQKNEEGKYSVKDFNAAYARFLYDIGYLEEQASSVKFNKDTDFVIEDYIDKNGGVDALLEINKGRKPKSIANKGYAPSIFGGFDYLKSARDEVLREYGISDLSSGLQQAFDEATDGLSIKFPSMESMPGLSEINDAAKEYGFDMGTMLGEGADEGFAASMSNPMDLLSGMLSDSSSEGKSNAASYVLGLLSSSFSEEGAEDGMMTMMSEISGMFTDGFDPETIKSTLKEKIGIGDNPLVDTFVDGIIDNVVSKVQEKMPAITSDTGTTPTVTPVVDSNVSSTYSNWMSGTSGLTLPSAVSLDEASKITLGSIEQKVNTLSEKLDTTAEKLKILGSIVENGFDMVKNKNGNVYLDGNALVGQIGDRVNRYIGRETYKTSRNR